MSGTDFMLTLQAVGTNSSYLEYQYIAWVMQELGEYSYKHGKIWFDFFQIIFLDSSDESITTMQRENDLAKDEYLIFLDQLDTTFDLYTFTYLTGEPSSDF